MIHRCAQCKEVAKDPYFVNPVTQELLRNKCLCRNCYENTVRRLVTHRFQKEPAVVRDKPEEGG